MVFSVHEIRAQNRKRVGCLAAGLILVSLLNCDNKRSLPAVVQQVPVPSTTPVAQSQNGEPPYADELKAFEAARAAATPFHDTYPGDAQQLVLIEFVGEHFKTTALGAAIWQGDRAQIETYLNGGADLTKPIWRSGETETHRTYAAHMAINAIYVQRVEPEYLQFILAHGADVNAMETTYAPSAHGVAYSQQSVLYHTVTSEISELTRIVLNAGVRDMAVGAGAEGHSVSPLTPAIIRGNVEAAKLLIDAGIDIEAGAVGKDGTVERPIDFARRLARKAQPELAKRIEEIIALLGEGIPESQ